MRPPIRLFPLLAAFAATSLAAPADLILKNGAIYTVDAARSWVSALAIANGQIVFAGPDSGALERAGRRTKIIDLAGRMVLPGFHDSHVHLIQGGRSLVLCNLNAARTASEAIEIAITYAKTHPDLPWIAGSGWELPLFPHANPTKAALDTAIPDRPVYLESSDGHSAWVNSRALALAHITRDTGDPADGRIERDSTGAPSGTLRESATALVSANIPPPTASEYRADLVRGLREASRFGITSFQDADADDATLDAYSTADHDGALTARVVAAMHVDPAKDDAQVGELAAKRAKYQGKLFRATSAKIFADGVIEPGTAALLTPYIGHLAGQNGSLNFEPARLNRLVIALDRAGFQVHIHAIGDRAVRVSLDAHEAAEKALGPNDLRPQIAHLELVDPADIPRFRQLNVIANFQALWAWPDSYVKDLTVPVLGPQRSRRLYPIGSIERTGAMIAGGSDWPVSSLNPLDAIQVAITRRGVDEPEGPAWIPEEKAGLATMIAAYTIAGAWVNHEEKLTGSLETGKAADLVVLDRNLFSVRPENIHLAKVLLALLGGKPVYSDGTLLPSN